MTNMLEKSAQPSGNFGTLSVDPLSSVGSTSSLFPPGTGTTVNATPTLGSSQLMDAVADESLPDVSASNLAGTDFGKWLGNIPLPPNLLISLLMSALGMGAGAFFTSGREYGETRWQRRRRMLGNAIKMGLLTGGATYLASNAKDIFKSAPGPQDDNPDRSEASLKAEEESPVAYGLADLGAKALNTGLDTAHGLKSLVTLDPDALSNSSGAVIHALRDNELGTLGGATVGAGTVYGGGKSVGALRNALGYGQRGFALKAMGSLGPAAAELAANTTLNPTGPNNLRPQQIVTRDIKATKIPKVKSPANALKSVEQNIARILMANNSNLKLNPTLSEVRKALYTPDKVTFTGAVPKAGLTGFKYGGKLNPLNWASFLWRKKWPILGLGGGAALGGLAGHVASQPQNQATPQQ